MRKPSFAVTGSTIVALSVVGVFKVIYEPLLPPSPTEYLTTIPSTESVPAPIVEINWKRSIAEAQEEAKRRKLGMLIFLLDPANYYAKQLELDGFRDPEVARFVNRSFVAVKINLDMYPEWAQTVLPVQRLGRYIEPGVDLIATNQDGKLINHYVVQDPFQYSGPESVLPFLIEAQVKLGQGSVEQPIQSQQSNDFQALVFAKAEGIPRFDEFTANLKKELKFRLPGIFEGGSTKFRPMALRILAKTGEPKTAQNVAKQMALTPLYDALDGGFFREARTSPWSVTIDTSKSATQNALSASVLAQLACLLKDADLRNLAVDIANDVMTEFSDGESICASRLNDQGVDLRSRRSSLTNARLNGILNGEQNAKLDTFISFSSSQSLSAFKNLSVLDNQEFKALRQLLRENIDYAPGLSEPDHIAVDGYVAARMFDLYRYTKDDRFLTKAKQIASQTYASIGEDSISRIYGNRQLGPGWLGSYLGVADCGLANFAATGEVYPLRNGVKALQLAIQKFRDSQTGLMTNTPVNPSPGFAFTSAVPDLADRGRESLNAMAIRLAYHLSIVAEEASTRRSLATFGQSVMVRLNSIMSKSSSVGSGYFDAVFDTIQNRAVVVSGPKRVEAANLLAAKLPLYPVYPLCLSNGDRKVQYYLREGELMEGPFSEAEILKKVEATPTSIP